jgi:hypothetical protein
MTESSFLVSAAGVGDAQALSLTSSCSRANFSRPRTYGCADGLGGSLRVRRSELHAQALKYSLQKLVLGPRHQTLAASTGGVGKGPGSIAFTCGLFLVVCPISLTLASSGGGEQRIRASNAGRELPRHHSSVTTPASVDQLLPRGAANVG